MRNYILHTATMITFPRAKLLFDAQVCLYSFLRVLIALVLGSADKDIEATGTAQLDRLASAKSSHCLGWAPHRLSHNSPFTSPALFIIGTMSD